MLPPIQLPARLGARLLPKQRGGKRKKREKRQLNFVCRRYGVRYFLSVVWGSACFYLRFGKSLDGETGGGEASVCMSPGPAIQT